MIFPCSPRGIHKPKIVRIAWLIALISNQGLAAVTAAEALAKYDGIMSPKSLKMTAAMVITREDLSSQSYVGLR
jgi:hypothetical protein